MSDEVIDPQNETWKRGDDPVAAAAALAEASMGTTGSVHHTGVALTLLREAAGTDEAPEEAAQAPEAPVDGPPAPPADPAETPAN